MLQQSGRVKVTNYIAMRKAMNNAERPQHESFLESEIPHYCKRHWMRPGLSGWAQVNASYASSLEASELKLSYDLFYLKNFSLWLDLIILFKTVKTILKAKRLKKNLSIIKLAHKYVIHLRLSRRKLFLKFLGFIMRCDKRRIFQ